MTTTDRYTSPLGDKRERPAPCRICRAETLALDGLCNRCFVNELEDGDAVVITLSSAGVLLGVDDSRFAGNVPGGTPGIYRGHHPNARLGDWLLVEVDAALVATLDSEGLAHVQPTVIAPIPFGGIAKP